MPCVFHVASQTSAACDTLYSPKELPDYLNGTLFVYLFGSRALHLTLLSAFRQENTHTYCTNQNVVAHTLVLTSGNFAHDDSYVSREQNKDQVRDIGKRARKRIVRLFSRDAVRDLVLQRLKAIQRTIAARHQASINTWQS
eukprot:m.1402304 g.1402304  ORF g.1402304 m.1402304 type:complete len:141 (+) comp25009_c0_seq59:2851-3273(+)